METIRHFRRNKGWTQEQLANAVGVKRAVISKYESGMVSPSYNMVQKIAAALDIPVTELVGDEGRIIDEKMLDEELDRTFFYNLDKHLAGLTAREKIHFIALRLPRQRNGQNIVSRQEKPLQRTRKRPQRGNKVIVCHRSDDMRQRTGEPII